MAARISIHAVTFLTAFYLSATSFPTIVSAQDCTPADITLSSQEEVDSFQANHGPCDHVPGELRIEGEDIINLQALFNLTRIDKLFIWRNPILTSLEGMSGLEYTGRLVISGNDSLTSLQGITALDRVGILRIALNENLISLKGLEVVEQVGTLAISGNSLLRNMEGLSSLTRVGGNWFEISNNSALESLDGLEVLNTVAGTLTIQDNNALTNIDGLASLTTAATVSIFNIEIQRNAALVNLDGLSSLTELKGALIIHLNDSLVDIRGLSNLTEIGAMLHIAANPALADLDGLEALTTVGALGIVNNATLKDFSGLSNLETVRLWFEISWNPMLTSLDGLSALTNVGVIKSPMSYLLIEYNETLNNLDGISTLHGVQNLIVEDNRSLADCQGIITLIDPIDDFEPGPGPGISGIPDIGNQARIQDNLDGCNSVNEILGKVPLLEINAGLNDAWFNPETNGQGFFIIVFPEIEQIFMSWFTYDTERPPADVVANLGEPGHRWLTAQGEYEENAAELDVYITAGGVFDSEEPTPITKPEGEIMLKFNTCNAGTVTYDIPSIDRQGEVPIERITLDNVPLCYLLGNQTADASLKVD